MLICFCMVTCEGQVVLGEKSQRQCVIESYTAEIGVRELTGNNDGYHVEKYLASTKLGKGYAWCAAFVNWNYRRCGVIGPQAAAWSPSWFVPGKITVHSFNTPETWVAVKQGDVFGIYFQNKGRIAHVGFIDEIKNNIRTVEGNTNDAGSREGDGVYRKYRLKKQIYATANWID